MNLKKKVGLFILNYLRIISKLQLKKFKPTIIGLTGSAGKTSLLYAVEAILSSKYKVKISKKANSESGIPANILGLEFNDYSKLDWFRICLMAPIKLLTNWEKYDYYVAEMGIDSPHEPKNMSYLLKILKPRVAVFLNVSAIHSEFFDNLINESITGDERLKKVTEAIAKEKGKIITTLPKEGIGIVNSDEELVYQQSLQTEAKILSFGKNNSPDMKICKHKVSKSGTIFEFEHKGQKYKLRFPNFLFPYHYGHTFAAAILVANSLEIDPSSAIISLEENFKLPPGRTSVITGIKESTIIDSSYNASYEATRDLIEMVNTLKARRKILVIGDHRELGKQTEILHRKLAHDASKTFKTIVTIGPQTKKYLAPELIKIGFKREEIHSFQTAGKAGRYIEDFILQDNDLILVKGSQNTIFTEIVTEMLMEDKSKADKLLCRRGKFWDEKRSDFI